MNHIIKNKNHLNIILYNIDTFNKLPSKLKTEIIKKYFNSYKYSKKTDQSKTYI